MEHVNSKNRAAGPGSHIGRDDMRAGREAAAIRAAIIDNLHYLQAKMPQHATSHDWYVALAYAVRDRMLDRYIGTVDATARPESSAKIVAYLSAEFLTGPHLGNGLVNLGIWDAAAEALSSEGQNLAGLLDHEEEPGLGNGGLGRLAACYWIRWPRSTCRRSDTASATSSASSTRRSATVGRSS